jgi:hypothetical protein
MPSLSPRLTVGKSGKHLVSQLISILRVVICFVLPGCVAQDDTVTPPQSQAPQIVVQPSIAVVGLGARITATINPNGIDTDCYFEYGATAAYGTKLPTKFIQAKLSDVVISDTVQNLAPDTTYHYRLVATNSAGTTQSTDKAFAVANLSPTILSETSVSISGPKMAVLTATVNANYRSTDCFFEYGQSTSYGLRTVSKSIGAGGGGVVVRDTIKGLSWDTTYHCRLVAENPAGRTVGSDQSFICASAGWVEFVYPLTVGTRWKYTYDWYAFPPIYYDGPRPGGHIVGSWIWEVKERTSADSVRIEVLRTESVARANRSDTLMTWTTSFMASIGQSYYTVRWFELMIIPNGSNEQRESRYSSYIAVPRCTESGINTVTLGHDNGDSDVEMARYVNGKGLVSWYCAYGMTSHRRETLTLDSVWVAP